MQQANGSKVARILSYLVAGIIMVLPFHAFLTVWLASNVGHYTALRLWKEVLLLAVLGLVWWLAWQDRDLKQQFMHNRLVWLITAYVLLVFGNGLVAYLAHGVNAEALGYGWIVDARFMIFFLLCAVLARQSTWLHWHWRRMLILPGIIVVAIGVLQFTVLPPDVMRHFGYDSQTIMALSTIDGKPELQRVQATLRGANPLGAYLVVVIAALAALVVKHRHMRYQRLLIAIAALVVLVASGSRAGMLGVVVALVVVGFIWLYDSGKPVKPFLLVCAVAGLVSFGSLVALRNNDTVQNRLFHTDEHSQSAESSNAARFGAMGQAAREVASHPLGEGVGTAGPASVHNNHPARIAENYFLQVGQEIGWLGLILFVTICGMVGKYLYSSRQHSLSLMLLASLVGLTVVNLVSHAWADDTLAYVWWGLAGIAVAPCIIRASNTDTDDAHA